MREWNGDPFQRVSVISIKLPDVCPRSMYGDFFSSLTMKLILEVKTHVVGMYVYSCGELIKFLSPNANNLHYVDGSDSYTRHYSTFHMHL